MRRRAVPVSVLVLILVAGCGDGSKALTKAQYEHHLQADGKAVLRSSARIAPQGVSTTPTRMERGLAQAQAELRRAADDLAGIEPPADAVADNEQIVRGLRAVAAAVEPLRRELASGTKVDVAKAVAGIQEPPAARKTQHAIDDLQRKGYKVGAFGI